MAIIKSNIANGITPVPTAGCAGAVVAQRAKHTFAAAGALNDILEIGILPARHYLVSAHLVAGDITAGTIGLLSGTPDDPDAGRTLGPAIITDGELNDTGYLTEPVEYDRGIGITLGAAAAAGDEVALIFTYAQG